MAPTNLGSDIMQGRGDLSDSPAYHADLSYDHGVRFVWRGRVTSVIGQDLPRSIRGVFSFLHPVASTRTIATEIAKGLLARKGNEKYAMHWENTLLRPVTLRDGHQVN